jgi:urease subunit gamma/beta
VRGHGELVDGALDDPAVRDAALAAAREKGYRGAEAPPPRGHDATEGGAGRA